MKTKTAKTQLEVWEAKERLSLELLRLPESKRIDYIIKKAKPVMDALKKKKVKK